MREFVGCTVIKRMNATAFAMDINNAVTERQRQDGAVPDIKYSYANLDGTGIYTALIVWVKEGEIP